MLWSDGMNGGTTPYRVQIAVGLAVATGLMAAPSSAQGLKRFAGIASYYIEEHAGLTASGASYDAAKFTAAHRTLPFGTRLRVTDTETQRSVVVTVNDRGPFVDGRVLDLSLAAAKALQMMDRGLVKVNAAPAPLSRRHREKAAGRRRTADPCFGHGVGSRTVPQMHGVLVKQLHKRCLTRAGLRGRNDKTERVPRVFPFQLFAAWRHDLRPTDR
jgi:rare lipoprotein A